MQATVLSTDGRQISQTELGGAGTGQLDISQLPAGLYVLQLEAGGRLHQQKLLVE